MTLHTNLKGDSLSWLLEDDNPGVRYLAMRDLLDLPPGDEALEKARQAAFTAGPIAAVLDEMHPQGYWVKPGPGYNPKYRSIDWSIILLAQLGASVADERVARACAYVLDHALAEGGKFSYNGTPSGTVDCLQGNLCWALFELGCQDERLEQAFDWMTRTVTGEGIAPAADIEAPDRFYAYKCGPNFNCGANGKKPCAWGAAKVMMAFSRLPAEKRTPPVQRAIQSGVDFFFSVDPAAAAYPTRTGAKTSRDWWKFGFPIFYVTDLLQIVEALAGLGYGGDPRLANALTLVREKQDSSGRWPLEYNYAGKTWVEFGEMHQPNKWVTLRALRVLNKAGM